jgi:hypothetical protein
VPHRAALLAAVAATAVAIVLGEGVAGDGAAASGVRPCRGSQLRFVAKPQPMNSAMTGDSITAKTTVPGLSCTLRGYPSVTLPPGSHGSVTVVMRPHLAGPGDPDHVVTVSGAGARSGGFYVINSWSCDAGSGEVYGLVRFGLANGDRVRGSTAMAFCRKSEAMLALSPFVG